MAFSLMAGLPAINGLYVSFFAIVMYLLLGTSKHLSHGKLTVHLDLSSDGHLEIFMTILKELTPSSRS